MCCATVQKNVQTEFNWDDLSPLVSNCKHAYLEIPSWYGNECCRNARRLDRQTSSAFHSDIETCSWRWRTAEGTWIWSAPNEPAEQRHDESLSADTPVVANVITSRYVMPASNIHIIRLPSYNNVHY